MATQLFKKVVGGWEETWTPAERVATLLANGWTVEKVEEVVEPVEDDNVPQVPKKRGRPTLKRV